MSARVSLTARVAALFEANRGRWIDGRELARVGGYAAFRTRISECRRPPFNLVVENRVRRVERPDGSKVTITEYRYCPTAERAEHGVDRRDDHPAPWGLS